MCDIPPPIQYAPLPILPTSHAVGFAGKLLSLLKRAQEGASEHVGKVPARKKTADADRQVTTLRLRRELQKAVDAENYEAAAQLRDKLRILEEN